MSCRFSPPVVRYGVAVLLAAAVLSAQPRVFSPDRKLYAVNEPGRKVGAGEERERFSIHSAAGTLVSVLHVWLIEPDGTVRAGIRGCESSGWIDSRRFFCEGSVNPSTGVYLWFDAVTGKELGEAVGTQFTWSPDRTTLAFAGNVPHFSDVEDKSDSLEVAGRVWPPESAGREQHWFRSPPSWSPDSKSVAVIDHQRRTRKAFFLEIVDAKTGAAVEHRLRWPDEKEEWPPALDFKIEWSPRQLTVRRNGLTEAFPPVSPNSRK